MQNSIEKYTLLNGLTVLLKEIHTTPIISQWVWYRVGSRNETPGIMGISHWVEHMQFKGTTKYPIDKLDHAITRVGGFWNAMTHLDWTTYYETIPSEAVQLTLDVEADRMQNSLFEDEEVQSERTVVISELEGNENEPLFHLNSAIQKKAFKIHPYNHDVIGTLDDLQSITREQLYGYYKNHYSPNNAILCLAGDFETVQLKSMIENAFRNIPSSDPIKQKFSEEPGLDSEKRLEIKGPGDALYIQLSYRSPKANSAEFFSLSVLDSLLSGPSPLVMFGGGSISNRSSRLYQALVEKDITVGISGGVQATIDPFLHTFVLTLDPTADPEKALQAFDEEIENIQNDPIDQSEVDRAIQQAEAMFAYGSENITNQAFWLGYSSIFADYDWYLDYLQTLRSVSIEDLQSLARKHLSPTNRIVGTYIPTQDTNHE